MAWKIFFDLDSYEVTLQGIGAPDQLSGITLGLFHQYTVPCPGP